MIETYDKMIFLSKESEKEWDEMPESVKKSALHLMKHRASEIQLEIQQEVEAQMMKQNKEFWIKRAKDYELLYQKQIEISEGYKELVYEYKDRFEGIEKNPL